MAQPIGVTAKESNELEIVEFYIEEELKPGDAPYVGYYGINVGKVLEIIREPKVTEMPHTPHPSVVGAFNLRSQVMPLVDLAKWLGKKRVPIPPKVIVTEFNSVVTAFLVSGVTRIFRLSWDQVEPPSAYLTHTGSLAFTGVVKLEGKVVFLLDLEQIVGDLNPALRLRLKNLDEVRLDEPLRALIVDDSPTIRIMIKEELEKARFEVEDLTDGQLAWERLLEYKRKASETGDHIFDYLNLVVSDVEMPRMSGHSLTSMIKSDPILKELPVILFSSMITDRMRYKGDSVGADDQVTKPEIQTLALRAKNLIADRVKSKGY